MKSQTSNSLLTTAIALVACVAVSSTALGQSEQDWASWRGPNGNGIAEKGKDTPLEWSLEKNVVWKTKVPGRGHASPIIVGDNIFMATADKAKQEQSVVCFSRETGSQKWQTVVNTGGLNGKIIPRIRMRLRRSRLMASACLLFLKTTTKFKWRL